MTDKKTFLTMAEVKEKADEWHEYEAGVYDYKVGGNDIFFESGDDYKVGGKCTLVEHGKVLIDNVNDVWWDRPGVYRYEKDDKIFEVKDGITTRSSLLP